MAYRFSNINSNMGLAAITQAVNRNFQMLDGEAVRKVFKGSTGNPALASGLLPDGTYGDLFYDKDGIARILITAQSPEDGEPVIAITKPGIDVVKALKGE
jgi:hypothetical protein